MYPPLKVGKVSAGIDATIRSLEIIAKTDLKVRVAKIPKPYKDPDELLKDPKDGGLALMRAHRGLPKNKALIKFLGCSVDV